MEKAYAYIRVSTETQAEKGYGKDVQENAIKEYCKENKLELVEVFRDLGISGTLIERDGFSELVAALSTSEVEKVIVMNTSRLWRSDTAKVFIKRELKKIEAHVISIEQKDYNIHSNEPNDFLVNGMMELLDQYDRLKINQSLANGRRQRAKSGQKACGVAPLGYKWTHEGGKRPIIEVNEKEAFIVKEIFKSYLDLKSIAKVQHLLANQGVETRQGKKFSTMSIRQILTNKFYIGELTHIDIKTKGQHEPLINRVVFGKVQAQLQRNKRRGA